jgi:hypothetical protein
MPWLVLFIAPFSYFFLVVLPVMDLVELTHIQLESPLPQGNDRTHHSDGQSYGES